MLRARCHACEGTLPPVRMDRAPEEVNGFVAGDAENPCRAYADPRACLPEGDAKLLEEICEVISSQAVLVRDTCRSAMQIG